MKITTQSVEKAKERLEGVIHHTSLYCSSTFSSLSNNKIYLKTENLQKTGSFKVRGAYNKISVLLESGELKDKSVVCASAGNHAQGVAYAATKNNIKSTIVMPKGTPIAKISATRGYGAQTILRGDFYDDAYLYAKEFAKKENAMFIHPFDDEAVIEGQATIAIEMLSDKPDLDCIIVPVGGGGLLAGVAFMAKQIKPSVKVFGVQAETANAAAKSFKKKGVISTTTAHTIADGIAVKTPGALTMAYINKYADGIFTVSDDEIATTIIHLVERGKMVVETAGATTLAIALTEKFPIKNKSVACVLSGGNIDVGLIHKIIERGLISRGRQMKLSVVLPDIAGSLENFAKIMRENNANIIAINYDRTSTELNINETILHIAFETEGLNHGRLVIDTIKAKGFKIL